MSSLFNGNRLDVQSARLKIVNGPGGSRFCLDRRDDVAEAFKDKRMGAATAPRHLLHALRWTGLGSVANVGELGLMVALNPPDHTRLRKVVDPVFRGLEGEAMARRIKNLADELAARIPKAGDFDLISDFAAPLPTRVVTELIGFPQTDLAKLKLWTEALAPLIDSGTAKFIVHAFHFGLFGISATRHGPHQAAATGAARRPSVKVGSRPFCHR